MLTGGDISHNNFPFEVEFGEFQIYKATEGRTWVDPKFAEYMSQRKNGEPMAFYHFARPENRGNTARLEAENFVATVKPWIGKAIFVLDWEGNALQCSADYALEWLQIVEELTGVKPIIYTSSSGTAKLRKVAQAGYELWVAHYNTSAPKIHYFKDWLMWQFTSKPFDVDLFKGTVEDWNKRCRSNL